MKRTLIPFALVAAIGAQAQTITEYRWWINDDVSTLTTTAAGPSADLTLSADLDLPALTRDYNTVTVQFKDSDGRYGAPYTMMFSRGTGAVNGYEWWIDDAIANSSSGTIGPNDVVDLIADLPTGTTSGSHVFTIRFSSTNGSWSVPLSTQFDFWTSLDELPGVTNVVLFPNPATDALGLRLTASEARQFDLQVLNATGQVVRSLAPWAVSGNDYRTWDISDLAAGSYLLRISDGRRVTSLPFVKP